jgi:hypothetical protein
MKPKRTHQKAATPKNKKITKTETQPNTKRKTENPTPRSLQSLQNIPPYSEATGTRGRRLPLAGVLVYNRTAAG